MMADPLKIISEIEADQDDGPTAFGISRWDELRESVEKMVQWNQDMVVKMASGGKLDAYREMGQKLARLEAENEQLRTLLRRNDQKSN